MRTIYLLALVIALNHSIDAISWKDLLIVSGTKWCGDGNVAHNCEDLGSENETDSCCRKHDYCPYTFSKNAPSYNGYSLNKFYTMSHCECDQIFHDCLHEKPYKEGSNYMWSSFTSLGVKCFAYLPCNSNMSAGIWQIGSKRRTGNCTNNLRVVEFNSVKDYQTFFENKIKLEPLQTVHQILETQFKSFITEWKQQQPCFKQFPKYSSDIAANFANQFINKKIRQKKNILKDILSQRQAASKKITNSDS